MAQKQLPIDSTIVKNAQDFFADDYANIYLYHQKDFSYSKYDTHGKLQAKVMFTLPFRMQSVQNPLSIFLFSENAQELKVLDQNLNEIQTVDFRQKFGFVKAAYTEDLQQIWLLDDSSKRLIQYNYRQDQQINSYPMDFDFERLLSILVYENKMYCLYESMLSIYNFNGDQLAEYPIENPLRMMRQNDKVFLVSHRKISEINIQSGLKSLFYQPDAKFVDKNFNSYFELKAAKVYLYNLGK